MSLGAQSDPDHHCALCPRLSDFIGQWRVLEPDWHNGPVPTWVPPEGDTSVKILVIGLAPGLRGANRTGRAFTGDASGNVLLPILIRHGLARGFYRDGSEASDELALVGTAITNAVRCVPPANKPVASEINMCRNTFLAATLARFGNLEAIITLGKIAHEATVRTLDGKLSSHRFSHNAVSTIGNIELRSSYHCSRYNMNTGVLTEAMFSDVFANYAVSERK